MDSLLLHPDRICIVPRPVGAGDNTANGITFGLKAARIEHYPSYDKICAYIDVPLGKGGGSAYGGAWKPAKSDDQRFIGTPGEIKATDTTGKHGGYHIDTKIGEDGKAIVERHYTDHFRPDKHTNPHDHMIDWSTGVPRPLPGINYPDGEPEFKRFGGAYRMRTTRPNTLEENRFKSISDFKWCINNGGEVEIEWNGRSYGIFSLLRNTKLQ